MTQSGRKQGWLPYWDDRCRNPLDHLPYWDDRRAGEYGEDEAQRHSPFVLEGDHYEEPPEPDIFAQVAQRRQDVAQATKPKEPSGAKKPTARNRATWLYGDDVAFRGLALDQGKKELAKTDVVKKGKDLGRVSFAGVQTGLWWGPAEVGDPDRAKPFNKRNFLASKGKVIIIAHGSATSLTLHDAMAYSRERQPYQKDGFDWTAAKGNITELVLLVCANFTEETLRKGMIEKPVTYTMRTVDPRTLQVKESKEKRTIKVTPIARDMANALKIPVTAVVGAADTVMKTAPLRWEGRRVTKQFKGLCDEFHGRPASTLTSFVRQFGALTSNEIKKGMLIGAWFDFSFKGKEIIIYPDKHEERRRGKK